MRKKLDKQEKIVVIVGSLLIASLTGTGLLKKTFGKEEPSFKVNDTTTLNNATLKLKQEKFAITKNSKVSKDANDYFTNKVSVLKDIKLDISKVDTSKVGTYEILATYNKKTTSIPIIVADSLNPILHAEKATFNFVLNAESTMQEVITYANVKANDVYGIDISKNITGWQTTLPTTPSTITYKLQVKDSEGKTSTLDIVVTFTTQADTETQNKPVNNTQNNTNTENTPPPPPPVTDDNTDTSTGAEGSESEGNTDDSTTDPGTNPEHTPNPDNPNSEPAV